MRIAAIIGLILVGNTSVAADAVDVDVSEFLGCALYDDGGVYCFGQFPGQEFEQPIIAQKVLGLPPAASIATGRFGACAIEISGLLWCWGLDYQRSERSQELVLSNRPFQVEGLPKVRAVDMGFNHICAISVSQEAWCWGMNTCGEVGCGHSDPVPEPKKVPYSEGVQHISAGVNNTCATFSGGELVCWGTDNPTQPGRPFIYESPDPTLLHEEYFGKMGQVSNGRNFACGIRRGGEVTCWGSNIMGQLGTETPRLSEGAIGIGEVEGVTDAKDIDASYFNACAVQNSQVICWGAPLFKSTSEAGAMSQPPTPVTGIEGATSVSLAPPFGCAVASGQVMCWGEEEFEGKPLIEGMTPTNPVVVPGMP